MTNELPKFTDEERLASTLAHAAHWERVANISEPAEALHCQDYAKHLRTIAECLRMDALEKQVLD